jgi:hypothetical protein
MAHSSNNPKSRYRKPKDSDYSVVPFSDYEFVRVDLTSGERDDLDNIVNEKFDVSQVIKDLAVPYAKIGIKQRDDGNVSVSCTFVDKRHHLAGAVITAFAPDVLIGMVVLWYKVTVVMEKYESIAHFREERGQPALQWG